MSKDVIFFYFHSIIIFKSIDVIKFISSKVLMRKEQKQKQRNNEKKKKKRFFVVCMPIGTFRDEKVQSGANIVTTSGRNKGEWVTKKRASRNFLAF